MNSDFKFHAIATVHSCYKEKFGIPRQAGLSESAESVIELLPPYNNMDYVRELEGFSHIWVIFIFHEHLNHEIKPTIRPPRLGGNKRVGVFASRSPFRPNPVGLSVVKLNKIDNDKNKIILHVSAADFVDGTPVIDIKPYIKYADSPESVFSSYADLAPENKLVVNFSTNSKLFINTARNEYPELEKLISETISLDPRPAYVSDSDKVYGIRLYDFNIKWKVSKGSAEVLQIENI